MLKVFFWLSQSLALEKCVPGDYRLLKWKTTRWFMCMSITLELVQTACVAIEPGPLRCLPLAAVTCGRDRDAELGQSFG